MKTAISAAVCVGACLFNGVVIASDTSGERYATRASHVLEDFMQIDGYFRAGYGRNNQGGSQVAFQAPGAMTKFRLGNEAENFGELIFGKDFYLPQNYALAEGMEPKGDAEGPLASVNIRLDFYNAYDNFSSGDHTNVGLPEAWVAINGVIDSQPELTFWAGNRFYRRHSSDINDFFYWNMSGGGFGFEDLKISGASLALAWIGNGKTSGFSNLPEPEPENEVGFSKSNIDLRLYDIDFLSGNLELGLIYSAVKAGLDANGDTVGDSDGYALNLVHNAEGFISDDGYHTFAIQYGTEAARTFTSGFETFALNDDVYIQPDLAGSSRLRVVEAFGANINDHFSLTPSLVYQRTDYGADIGSETWVSLGLRPIAHIDRHWSVALEAGIDHVKNINGDGNKLYKLTLAPQLSLGNRHNSRPVIRAFITYAAWDEAFIGRVGGLDYADKDSGVTAGVQMDVGW